ASGGHGALTLLAQAGDAQAHRLAGPQVARRLLPHADAGRRTCGDDVARLQAHEAAEGAHEPRDAEHHRARVAVLVAVAVDLEPEIQRLRVGHLVGRHQPGAEGPEGVVALALVPLAAAALELDLALGDVVDDAVARHVRHRRALVDVASAGADHDAEL